MRTDGCVARRASQVFVLPIRDMLVSFRVPVFLREPIVNHVNLNEYGEDLIFVKLFPLLVTHK